MSPPNRSTKDTDCSGIKPSSYLHPADEWLSFYPFRLPGRIPSREELRSSPWGDKLGPPPTVCYPTIPQVFTYVAACRAFALFLPDVHITRLRLLMLHMVESLPMEYEHLRALLRYDANHTDSFTHFCERYQAFVCFQPGPPGLEPDGFQADTQNPGEDTVTYFDTQLKALLTAVAARPENAFRGVQPGLISICEQLARPELGRDTKLIINRLFGSAITLARAIQETRSYVIKACHCAAFRFSRLKTGFPNPGRPKSYGAPIFPRNFLRKL